MTLATIRRCRGESRQGAPAAAGQGVGAGGGWIVGIAASASYAGEPLWKASVRGETVAPPAAAS